MPHVLFFDIQNPEVISKMTNDKQNAVIRGAIKSSYLHIRNDEKNKYYVAFIADVDESVAKIIEESEIPEYLHQFISRGEYNDNQ